MYLIHAKYSYNSLENQFYYGVDNENYFRIKDTCSVII